MADYSTIILPSSGGTSGGDSPVSATGSPGAVLLYDAHGNLIASDSGDAKFNSVQVADEASAAQLNSDSLNVQNQAGTAGVYADETGLNVADTDTGASVFYGNDGITTDSSRATSAHIKALATANPSPEDGIAKVSSIPTSTSGLSDSTDKRFVSDAALIVIGNTSGANTGDETESTIKTKLGITTLSGDNTGDQTNISGNAGTATKLATARKINGVDFDGSGDISVPGLLSSGTYASRPAAGVAGRVYLPTNAYYPSFDNGAAWQPLVDGMLFSKPPAVGDLSQINFGTYRTAAQDGDCLLVSELGDGSGSNSYGAMVTAIPGSGAYSLLVGFDVLVFNNTTSEGAFLGLCITDGVSAGAKILAYFMVCLGGTTPTYLGAYCQSLTAPGTFGATPIIVANNQLGMVPYQQRWFMKITDDRSANITFTMSQDLGKTWDAIQGLSTAIGRTTYFTPSHVGLFTGHGAKNIATTYVRHKARIFHWSLG